MIDSYLEKIKKIPQQQFFGTVTSVVGSLIEISGIKINAAVGDRCAIHTASGKIVLSEIIGFRSDKLLVMPYEKLEGIGLGNRADLFQSSTLISPTPDWLGRVLNGLGEPIDKKGALPHGSVAYNLHASPPPAHQRKRVKEVIDLGVRAINTFTTCCQGQRMGIFSGSGVGKSILLSMLAKFTNADVVVIGLIGERGREVQEFLQDNLGEEGLKKSVLVVATSDESPLMRRAAADLTLTVSEYFRDQGNNVLCLMDSVTRFAMAQREIGLSVGEPPTSKGYPPSVFSLLPKLLERAGPGVDKGTITGLFTVLVEGDDHNEPISDTVRSILDGHVVLERKIAERGRYPAINVLKSLSRTMPDCQEDTQAPLVIAARRLLSLYDDMEDMIRLGAYQQGTNPELDTAIAIYPRLEAFLSQEKNTPSPLINGFEELREIVGPLIPSDGTA